MDETVTFRNIIVKSIQSKSILDEPRNLTISSSSNINIEARGNMNIYGSSYNFISTKK